MVARPRSQQIYTISRKSHKKNNPKFDLVINYKRKILPQILVFFTIQNVGLRPLEWFTREILDYPLKIHQIQEIINKAGERSEKILQKTDILAGEKAEVIEMDTTWKGRYKKFFAAIEQKSHYLFEWDMIKNESEKVITPILHRLKNTCFNLKVIITDMALGFESLIPKIFPFVQHLNCNVHGARVLFRWIETHKEKVSQALTRVKKASGNMRIVDKWLSYNRIRLYRVRSYLKSLQKRKFNECKKRGIKVKPNGALYHTAGGLPPDLKPISNRIYKFEAKSHRLLGQVKRQLKKQRKYLPKLQNAQQKYYKVNARYMYYCRIIARFKRLCNIKDQKEFHKGLTHFQQLLVEKKDPFCTKVYKFLNDHPKLFRANQPKNMKLLNTLNISTNTIEGFFSKTRLMLDNLRNTPNTLYIHNRLILFRFWHNVVGPLSGHNAHVSPCHRLGIRLCSNMPIKTICQWIEI